MQSPDVRPNRKGSCFTFSCDGDIVVVKIQRPFVLETVSLDLCLAWQIGLFVRNFPHLTDKFYQELDYDVECDSGNHEVFA